MVTRRAWLAGAASLGVGLPLALLWQRKKSDAPPVAGLVQKSPPLLLPAGFSCHVLIRAGERLGDGTRSADCPDGMACFADARGRWILLRNHELHRQPARGAFPNGNPPEAFDPAQHGGVSRLVVHPEELRVLESNTVLAGTSRNCSGGPSPWGWLTCEESEDEGHGWVFACSTDARRIEAPRRLDAYGRFRHEAVAVEPRTRTAYLTEDQYDGLLYRFTPAHPERPFEGRLEALALVEGAPLLGNDLRPGRRHAVRWVPIADPSASRETTRAQGHRGGALRLARGEGAAFDPTSSRPSVVFAATAGGPLELGQLFRLHLGGERDELELLAHASERNSLRGPDNLCVAPSGDVIVAEDGPRTQHLLGLTPEGHLYAIAQNDVSSGEFAGVCFSPDGSTLFCNLQREGLTLALRGPWHNLRAGAA